MGLIEKIAELLAERRAQKQAEIEAIEEGKAAAKHSAEIAAYALARQERAILRQRGLETELRRPAQNMGLAEEVEKLRDAELRRQTSAWDRAEAYAQKQLQAQEDAEARRQAEIERKAATRNRLQRQLDLLGAEQLLKEVQKLRYGIIDPEPTFNIEYPISNTSPNSYSSAIRYITYPYTRREEKFREVQIRDFDGGLAGHKSVADGWEDVNRKLIIGVGVQEFYPGTEFTNRLGTTQALVISNDTGRRNGDYTSTTEFLPDSIAETRRRITQMAAQHYTRLPSTYDVGRQRFP